MKCFICKQSVLAKFLSLGHQPPSDAFLRPADLEKPEATYPLDLYFCQACHLVQLGYVVPPEILFRDYVYTTGTNNALRANFKQLVDALVARFHPAPGTLAIDVGSNDGTLLKNFLPYGIKILGIDPSSVAAAAKKAGVPTMVDFFNAKVAARAKRRYGTAELIAATNVFAHVDDLHSFVRGVKTLLAPRGVFVSESHSLIDIVERLQYDSIYHEHLRYYSLATLVALFEKFGLEVFDVERIASHNGSLRVYAARPGVHPINPHVAALLKVEAAAGLERLETLEAFAKRVTEHRLEFQRIVIDLKSQGKRIVGLGAPAKGNTLLNACRLGPEAVDYLTDRSPLKIGLYSPGVHIPVVADERLIEDQPDYAIVLSWNIADELIKKVRGLGYKGKFIVPFPTITIK